MTSRQERFVEEYLVDLNATAAAIRAGYSPKTARQTGAENLSKHVIRAAIKSAMADRSERCAVSADEVVLGLKEIAFANLADLVRWDDDGIHLTPSKDLPRELTAAVSEVTEIRTSKATTVRLKMYDRLGALNSLLRHLEAAEIERKLTELEEMIGAREYRESSAPS